MWLQPAFFSTIILHFGHFAESRSSFHFFNSFIMAYKFFVYCWHWSAKKFTFSQLVLSWYRCPHFPHISSWQCLHVAFSAFSFSRTITSEHAWLGHHLQRGSVFTLILFRNFLYFWKSSLGIIPRMVFSSSSSEQCGQIIFVTYRHRQKLRWILLLWVQKRYLVVRDLSFEILNKTWLADVMWNIIITEDVCSFYCFIANWACYRILYCLSWRTLFLNFLDVCRVISRIYRWFELVL